MTFWLPQLDKFIFSSLSLAGIWWVTLNVTNVPIMDVFFASPLFCQFMFKWYLVSMLLLWSFAWYSQKKKKKKLHLCSCMFGFFSTEMLKNLLIILIQAGIYSFIAKEAFTPDNISESKASTKMICGLQMFKLCPLKVVNTSLYGLHITPSFVEDVWPSEGILAFISFSLTSTTLEKKNTLMKKLTLKNNIRCLKNNIWPSLSL